MKFQKYLNEAKTIKRKTKKDKTGHGHLVEVDDKGNGKTTRTVGTKDHVHKVVEWEIQPSNGHMHTLEQK